MTGFRDLVIGRLGLPTVGTPVTEQLGSELTSVGDATAVGQRRAKGFTLTFPIHGTPGDSDLQQAGNRMRRQLRSLMQNAPYRLGGLYVRFSYDPERGAWLVLGQGELADANGGVPFAEYQLTLSQAFVVAQRQTHREAFRLDIVDRRQVTSALDYLGAVVNTGAWFSSLPNLPIVALPTGAADVTVLGSPVTTGQRSGQDGSLVVVPGSSNGDVISWERPEASFNLGDVVVYDRRGNLGPFGAAAYDASPFPTDVQASYGWDEIYGGDWPYSWLTAGQPADTPVLANSLCRVRFDASNTPGFRVDGWDGSSLVEQGKIVIARFDPSGRTFLDTLVSSTVREYTPERTVVEVILRSSVNAASRELVYLTLQRGWSGPRVEVYCAPYSGSVSGVGADVYLVAATADANDSAYAVDSSGAAVQATAGSGSSLFASSAAVGAASFPAENWLAMLRQGQAFTATMAVLQPSAQKLAGQTTSAYGSARNCLIARVVTGGYLSTRLGLSAQTADQVIEAESALNGSSTTAGVVSDSGASGGSALRDTQATAAAATMLKTGSSLISGAKYRAVGRVREDTGANAIYKVVLGGTAGAPLNKPFAAWTWVDLGEIIAGGSGQVAVYAYGGSTVGSIAAPGSPAATRSVLGGQMTPGTYYYKVTSLKGAGETTGSSEVSAVIPATLTPPAGVAAAPASTGGQLPAGSYYYVVTAVNANGETTGSSEVSATFNGTLVAPSSLVASPSTGEGSFAAGTYYYVVTAVNANGETTGSSEVSAVIGANLPAPTGVQAALASTAGALLAGTYYYKVTAVNANGETTGSSEVSAVIGAIPAPAGVTATGASGGTLAAGSTYYYKVTAVNANGETTGSSEVSVAGVAAIASPTGVTATPSGTGGHMVGNTQFFYVVTAVNANGETLRSTEVAATTPAGSGSGASFVNSAGTTFTGTGGVISAAKPTGVISGDVMIAQVDARGSSSSVTITPPTGGGWTQVGTTQVISTGGGLWKSVAYFAKPEDGTAGPYAFTVTGVTNPTIDVLIGAYRGVLVPETYHLQANASSLSPQNSGVTPAAAGETLVWFCEAGSGSSTGPSGYTQRAAANTWTLADKFNAAAGPTGSVNGGGFGGGSFAVSITGLFALPLAPVNTASVAVGWNPVTGATGYRVYRATSSGGQTTSPALVAAVSGGSTTSYTDTAASPSAGAAPTANTTAVNAANLAWGAVAGATGYRVYRATSSGGEIGATSLLADVSDGASTSYADTGSATTTGSVPATNTTGGAGAIALEWNPVAGATGYRIYRATTAGGETGGTSLVASISDGSAGGWTDTGATAFSGSVPGSNTAAVTTGSVGLAWNAVPGAASYNVYRATTSGGETGGTSLVGASSANTFTDPGGPTSTGSVPASNTATLSTGQVTLTWASVAGAASYNVYRAGTSGGETSGSTQLATGVSAAAFTDDGTATPAALAAPTSNTAAVTTGSVAVTWAAVTNATGYRIYRATSSGAEGTSPTLVGQVGTVTSFTDVAAAASAGQVPGSNTTGGAGAYIDRLELLKVEDRTRASAPYDGVRDHAQAHLADVQPQQQRSARA